jgi:hypothetical protein
MRIIVAAVVAVSGIAMFAIAALVWDRRRQLIGTPQRPGPLMRLGPAGRPAGTRPGPAGRPTGAERSVASQLAAAGTSAGRPGATGPSVSGPGIAGPGLSGPGAGRSGAAGGDRAPGAGDFAVDLVEDGAEQVPPGWPAGKRRFVPHFVALGASVLGVVLVIGSCAGLLSF